MTICFYGASVTKQKSGYATHIKRMLEAVCGEIYIHGYGGTHLCDAGICFIDQVLKKNPSVCFIDWFSTGYNSCDEKTIEYIETIVYKFSKANCKVVFLFFPHTPSVMKDEFYSFCESYLAKRNIPFLRVDKALGEITQTDILRDNIHTTKYGSELYAEVIIDKIINRLGDIHRVEELVPTPYIDIKQLDVFGEYKDRIVLKGNCEIVGCHLLIGPYSGIIEIENDNTNKEYNTWDRWCHYTREHFDLAHKVNGTENLRITNRPVDYTEGKYQWMFCIHKKRLVIYKIYYVGNDLQVYNLAEKKHIRKYHYKLWNIFTRVVQIIMPSRNKCE